MIAALGNFPRRAVCGKQAKACYARIADLKIKGITLQLNEIISQVTARLEAGYGMRWLEDQWLEIDRLYQTAPVGFAYFKAKDLSILRINRRQAEMFHLPNVEVKGRTVAEIMPLAPAIPDLLARAASGQRVENVIVTGQVGGKRQIPITWLVNFTPVVDRNGEVEAVWAVSLEITAQKRAEAALIESEKLADLGRMASSIEHEINNPLGHVSNLLYLIGQHDNPAEVQEMLAMAQQELQRVVDIASQTLRFQRAALAPRAVTCAQLFSTVIDMYRARLKTAQIEVHKRRRAERPLECLEGDVRQVLNNVIGNAIDAMPNGGCLFLRSREADDPKSGRRGLCLTVADTGCGMAREIKENVFKPFFTTKGVNGSGLGLWISAEITQRHNGTIRIRSRQSGQHHGTVVTLFLPYESRVENMEAR
jgi:signal transduction histidine kinase